MLLRNFNEKVKFSQDYEQRIFVITGSFLTFLL